MVDPAWEDEGVERSAATFQPSQETGPRSIEELELNETACFLLDNDGTVSDPAADDEFTDLDLHDVAAAQLAVDR